MSALAVVAAGVVLAGGARRARADGSGFNRAVLHSERDEALLGGEYVKLSSVTMARSGSTYTLTLREGARQYQMVLQPPTGQSFTKQRYQPIAKEATPTQAGVNFLGGVGTCATITGLLDVKSIATSGSEITSLAIEFDLYCDGSPKQMGGWLAYNQPYGPMDPVATGEFVGVKPVRALDTRTDAAGPLRAGQPRSVKVTGIGEVPEFGPIAVIANVTATEPTGVGHLSLWPTGTVEPTVSNVNFVAGQTVPNLAIVKVGDGGTVQLASGGSGTAAIVDVLGWFAPSEWNQGARFHSVAPSRLLDTRTAGQVALGPGESRKLSVGTPGQYNGVILNVTATQASQSTHVTVYPSDAGSLPLASNLNAVPGESVPNLVITKVAADGTVTLYNAAGTTHLVVDLMGRFDGDRSSGAGRYVPRDPKRLVDTRWSGYMVHAGSRLDLGLTGLSGTLPFEWSAVVANTTVTETSDESHLTAWATNSAQPWASNLNWKPGETRPNLVVSGISADGFVSVATAHGSTHVVVDLAGWFTA
jgi:hypothetical protein